MTQREVAPQDEGGGGLLRVMAGGRMAGRGASAAMGGGRLRAFIASVGSVLHGAVVLDGRMYPELYWAI